MPEKGFHCDGNQKGNRGAGDGSRQEGLAGRDQRHVSRPPMHLGEDGRGFAKLVGGQRGLAGRRSLDKRKDRDDRFSELTAEGARPGPIGSDETIQLVLMSRDIDGP